MGEFLEDYDDTKDDQRYYKYTHYHFSRNLVYSLLPLLLSSLLSSPLPFPTLFSPPPPPLSRGGQFARRRRERELEKEEDEKDRQREKEEIEALRLEVMERQVKEWQREQEVTMKTSKYH